MRHCLLAIVLVLLCVRLAHGALATFHPTDVHVSDTCLYFWLRDSAGDTLSGPVEGSSLTLTVTWYYGDSSTTWPAVYDYTTLSYAVPLDAFPDGALTVGRHGVTLEVEDPRLGTSISLSASVQVYEDWVLSSLVRSPMVSSPTVAPTTSAADGNWLAVSMHDSYTQTSWVDMHYRVNPSAEYQLMSTPTGVIPQGTSFLAPGLAVHGDWMVWAGQTKGDPGSTVTVMFFQLDEYRWSLRQTLGVIGQDGSDFTGAPLHMGDEPFRLSLTDSVLVMCTPGDADATGTAHVFRSNESNIVVSTALVPLFGAPDPYNYPAVYFYVLDSATDKYVYEAILPGDTENYMPYGMTWCNYVALTDDTLIVANSKELVVWGDIMSNEREYTVGTLRVYSRHSSDAGQWSGSHFALEQTLVSDAAPYYITRTRDFGKHLSIVESDGSARIALHDEVYALTPDVDAGRYRVQTGRVLMYGRRQGRWVLESEVSSTVDYVGMGATIVDMDGIPSVVMLGHDEGTLRCEGTVCVPIMEHSIVTVASGPASLTFEECPSEVDMSPVRVSLMDADTDPVSDAAVSLVCRDAQGEWLSYGFPPGLVGAYLLSQDYSDCDMNQPVTIEASRPSIRTDRTSDIYYMHSVLSDGISRGVGIDIPPGVPSSATAVLWPSATDPTHIHVQVSDERGIHLSDLDSVRVMVEGREAWALFDVETGYYVSYLRSDSLSPGSHTVTVTADGVVLTTTVVIEAGPETVSVQPWPSNLEPTYLLVVVSDGTGAAMAQLDSVTVSVGETAISAPFDVSTDGYLAEMPPNSLSPGSHTVTVTADGVTLTDTITIQDGGVYTWTVAGSSGMDERPVLQEGMTSTVYVVVTDESGQRVSDGVVRVCLTAQPSDAQTCTPGYGGVYECPLTHEVTPALPVSSLYGWYGDSELEPVEVPVKGGTPSAAHTSLSPTTAVVGSSWLVSIDLRSVSDIPIDSADVSLLWGHSWDSVSAAYSPATETWIATVTTPPTYEGEASAPLQLLTDGILLLSQDIALESGTPVGGLSTVSPVVAALDTEQEYTIILRNKEGSVIRNPSLTVYTKWESVDGSVEVPVIASYDRLTGGHKVVMSTSSWPEREMNVFVGGELLMTQLISIYDSDGSVQATEIGHTKEESDGYGGTFAIASPWMWVGAPHSGADDSGKVYVFRETETGGWEEEEPILSHTPTATGLFGSALTLSDTYGYITQPGTDSVEVHIREGDSWSYRETLSIPHGMESVIDSDGSRVVAGGGLGATVSDCSSGSCMCEDSLLPGVDVTDVAISGGVLAVSTSDGETMLFQYNTMYEEWVLLHTLPYGGGGVSLSDDTLLVEDSAFIGGFGVFTRASGWGISETTSAKSIHSVPDGVSVKSQSQAPMYMSDSVIVKTETGAEGSTATVYTHSGDSGFIPAAPIPIAGDIESVTCDGSGNLIVGGASTVTLYGLAGPVSMVVDGVSTFTQGATGALLQYHYLDARGSDVSVPEGLTVSLPAVHADGTADGTSVPDTTQYPVTLSHHSSGERYQSYVDVPTQVGQSTVTTDAGGVVVCGLIQVVAGPPVGGASTLETSEAVAGETSTIALRLKSSYGDVNLVEHSVSVTWNGHTSPAAMDSKGRYTVELLGGTVAGDSLVRVSVGDTADFMTGTVTIKPAAPYPPKSTLSFPITTVVSGSDTRLTATLQDEYGNEVEGLSTLSAYCGTVIVPMVWDDHIHVYAGDIEFPGEGETEVVLLVGSTLFLSSMVTVEAPVLPPWVLPLGVLIGLVVLRLVWIGLVYLLRLAGIVPEAKSPVITLPTKRPTPEADSTQGQTEIHTQQIQEHVGGIVVLASRSKTEHSDSTSEPTLTDLSPAVQDDSEPTLTMTASLGAAASASPSKAQEIGYGNDSSRDPSAPPDSTEDTAPERERERVQGRISVGLCHPPCTGSPSVSDGAHYHYPVAEFTVTTDDETLDYGESEPTLTEMTPLPEGRGLGDIPDTACTMSQLHEDTSSTCPSAVYESPAIGPGDTSAKDSSVKRHSGTVSMQRVAAVPGILQGEMGAVGSESEEDAIRARVYAQMSQKLLEMGESSTDTYDSQ
ncbi:hypothetical protein KIPB_005579 [Kipferlia bialata]|uniref:Ig-like domain-containing protein n=1 Tax=Kipferlia bialata TaxID=797122 RepID=A0A9K3CVU4_9EUKA|nr:hypothetical protein KIPB_005579 [Kipferlia bialata]|eukprot:g5579.t1